MTLATGEIDHLVVTAPSLRIGAEFVRSVLGVPLQLGGEHVRMATHNQLVRLGASCYLEVIATNPAAAAPDRPRWFALDVAGPAPVLATWVARTADIRIAAAATEPLGTIEAMQRGELEWLITIPPDGSLPLGGTAPALIQWGQGTHPAATLPDQGLTLLELELLHPQPERLERLLTALGIAGPLRVLPAPSAGLAARILTPEGECRLQTADFAGGRSMKNIRRRRVARVPG